MSIESIAKEVVEELERAERKFAGFNSSHEGYAVLLEEVDELWDVVKLNPKKIMVDEQEFNYPSDIPKIQIEKRKKMMRVEAVQVAAMAMRFINCVCDENMEEKS